LSFWFCEKINENISGGWKKSLKENKLEPKSKLILFFSFIIVFHLLVCNPTIRFIVEHLVKVDILQKVP